MCCAFFFFFGPDWSSAGPPHNRGQNLIINVTGYASFGPRGSDLAASISAELIFARLLFAFYPWGRGMVRTVYRTHVTWGASVANERAGVLLQLTFDPRAFDEFGQRSANKQSTTCGTIWACLHGGGKFVSLKYSNAPRRRQLRPRLHGVWFK